MNLEPEFIKKIRDDYGVNTEDIYRIMNIINKLPMIDEEYIESIVRMAASNIANDRLESKMGNNGVGSAVLSNVRPISEITLNAIVNVWYESAILTAKDASAFKIIVAHISDQDENDDYGYSNTGYSR